MNVARSTRQHWLPALRPLGLVLLGGLTATFAWNDNFDSAQGAPPAAATTADEAQAEDSADKDYSAELPRIAPTEPAEALATFETRPGFQIEQVAAEPLVRDPVAAAFDADGRLYVVEMCDYSEDSEGHLGAVRLLEDTDGDGRFDRSSNFAEGLSWPTAIACYDGGVFVGAAPFIFYLKDTDGDGRADVNRTVFEGLGRSNVQGLVNSFNWGLDNRIHAATSSSGASLRRPVADGGAPDAQPVTLSGRDFSFDPRTMEVKPESGGVQHGLSFDRWGRKFVCANSDHIQLVMFEDRYVARNPHLAAPGARISIAVDGPQAEVFRISPVEPWRIVRSRLRKSGIVPGIVEGGGRPAGYFTGATGTTIYRGDAWPAEYLDNSFTGDVGSNIVHRKKLTPQGVELSADRAEPGVEFVASRDIWFRPCQFLNAPDGTLYILDVYREVIEHPLSLPPVIKKHLDLTSGSDRGRIYRVVPQGFQQPPLPRLSNATTAELVATLDRANGWHRDTAARLIYERQDQSAIAPLEQLARAGERAEGRMHALYALDGLNALSADLLGNALKDKHPRVREHAIRLAEAKAAQHPELQTALVALATDDDPLVRYQLAFSLGELPASAERRGALATIARRDANDRWVRLALQSSLASGAGELLAVLLADREFSQAAGAAPLVTALAAQVSAEQKPDELAAVLRAVAALHKEHASLASAVVRGLGEGLARHGRSLHDLAATTSDAQIKEVIAKLLADARDRAANGEFPVAVRVDAIGTLPLDDFSTVEVVLAGLIDGRQPQEIQLAALAALSRFSDDGVAELVLTAWPSLGPRVRAEAGEVLFARPQRIAALLAALESKRIAGTDLDPARLKALVKHNDREIAARAESLVGQLALGRRQDVVAMYRPALELSGDVERGRAVFRKTCAACHKLEGAGHEIGPNLATIQNRGSEAILLNVLDPNREVNPQYVNYTLITTDGRSITGMMAAETATSVTLRRAEGAEDTILRSDIDELASTSLSIMPEGLEKEIDAQSMADLLAYLNSIK
ncbi:MAG: c-type cytochrome [Pirellulales bacterium]|nr:c-type cytochrome [Pirellulales bacterium]